MMRPRLPAQGAQHSSAMSPDVASPGVRAVDYEVFARSANVAHANVVRVVQRLERQMRDVGLDVPRPDAEPRWLPVIAFAIGVVLGALIGISL